MLKQKLCISIYKEHLTETGFLLAYRLSYFQDPAISWPDVAELEERIAAHVDGIELGGDLARECAIEFLQSADQDEVTGAAYALATVHIDQEAGLDAAIEAFTKAPDDAVVYFVDAFKYARHPKFTEKMPPLLRHERPLICAAAAEILGYRRDADVRRLWPLLHHDDGAVLSAAVTALVRMGDREALPALEGAILNGGPPPQDWLLLLLWLGSRRALDILTAQCANAATVSSVGLSCLAMAGGRDVFSILERSTRVDGAREAAYFALGIFGDARALALLLEALSEPDDAIRVAAGEALQWITAAGLRETVMIEETDNELTPEDVTGQPASATAEAVKPVTREVTRVCTQVDVWRKWWSANAKQFAHGTRFRHGKAFTLGVCIDDMADTNRTATQRQNAYMELMIRAGRAFPFEPDYFVYRQNNALSEIRAWWAQEQIRFQHNPWVCFGAE